MMTSILIPNKVNIWLIMKRYRVHTFHCLTISMIINLMKKNLFFKEKSHRNLLKRAKFHHLHTFLKIGSQIT